MAFSPLSLFFFFSVLFFVFVEDSFPKLDAGDRGVFLDYVQKNMHLHEFRAGIRLSTPAAASWMRRALADGLRSRSPYRGE